MRYILTIMAMIASVYAVDFEHMSTENMMGMRGNVPTEQQADFRKEMQERMQSMSPEERQKYFGNRKGMMDNQGKGMHQDKSMMDSQGKNMQQGMKCGKGMMEKQCKDMMDKQGKGMHQEKGMMDKQGKGMHQDKSMMNNPVK